MVAAGNLNGISEALGMPTAMESLAGFCWELPCWECYTILRRGPLGWEKATAMGILLGATALAGILLAGSIAAGFGALSMLALRLFQKSQLSLGGRLSNALRGNMQMAPIFPAGLLLHQMDDGFYKNTMQNDANEDDSVIPF